MEHMAEEYANGFARLYMADRNDFVRKLTTEELEERKLREIYGNSKTSNNIFANIKKKQHEEYQYLNLIENILENGTWEEGRNGKTKSIFGASMRFSLKDGKIPILTTKKTAWKTCLKELSDYWCYAL